MAAKRRSRAAERQALKQDRRYLLRAGGLVGAILFALLLAALLSRNPTGPDASGFVTEPEFVLQRNPAVTATADDRQRTPETEPEAAVDPAALEPMTAEREPTSADQPPLPSNYAREAVAEPSDRRPAENTAAPSEQNRGTRPASSADPTLPLALVERADDDIRRFEGSPDDWTLQVGAFCNADSVQSLLDRHGASNEFHLIPFASGERACFRVCWGRYADRASGGQAELPVGLSRRDDPPRVRRIGEVLP